MKEADNLSLRGVAKPVTLRLRPQVADYAQNMEIKLAKNDHKEHWSKSTVGQLLSKLGEELEELIEALDQGATAEEVMWECVDVGAVAMMIGDNYLRKESLHEFNRDR